MASDELKWYIEQAALRGLLKEAKQELLKSGWPADDVDRVFVSLKPIHRRRSLLWFGIAGAIGFFAGWAGLYSAYSTTPEIAYEQYSAIGDQIVVTFDASIGEEAAKKRFSIIPEPEGDLIWMDDIRELHFVPYEGFLPEESYSVEIKMSWRSLLPPFSGARSFTFSAERAEAIIGDMLPIAPTMSERDGPVRSIDANLETMQLTLLEDGMAVKQFPIGAIGNPYSGPTPIGSFDIKTKEPNHFSSISKVWMPYSMQFQGDYFLHGWPYWPDGTRYEGKYSGGCIRLEEDIAKEVFEWASIGVSLFVHEEPGQTFAFSVSVLESGDIVREGDSPQRYEVKMVGEKQFKRPYFGDEENVIPVAAGGLDEFQDSYWAVFAEQGVQSVYEIDYLGNRAALTCGKTPFSSEASSETCYDVWELYGGDSDELFTLSDQEWDNLIPAPGYRLTVR